MSTAKPPSSTKPFNLFRKDRAKRTLVAIQPMASNALTRFIKFQQWTIDHASKLSPSARAVALLISEAAVVTSVDLPLAYQALNQTFECSDKVMIEWTLPDGSIDRRELGRFMRLWMGRANRRPSFEKACTDLVATASATRLYHLNGTDSVFIEQILEDAQAFARLSLPPALFSHVLNYSKFTALPRSCLARHTSKLALSIPPTLIPTPQHTDQSFERALEAALLGHQKNAAGAAAFVRDTVIALLPPSRGSVAAKRKVISDRLCSLGAVASLQDHSACLFYCFAVDLFENGTPFSRDVAVGTPYDYLKSIALDFTRLFTGIHIKDLKPEEFASLFKQLRGAAPTPKQSAATSALHHFLRSWDIAPALPAGTLARAEDTEVQANCIWPHEIDALFRWLTDATDNRLHSMARCALAIGCVSPVRIGELLWLRLEGVRIYGDLIEIDVAPRLSDPLLKSDESRRRLHIRDRRSISIISSWVTRRRLEEAKARGFDDTAALDLIQGYMFGDPNHPNRPFRPVALAQLLNRLLKAVTGDLSIGFHMLRHTQGSTQTSASLTNGIDGDVNNLDLEGSAMGHASGQTKLISYSHEYERSLRVNWDKFWHTSLKLTSSDVAFWTGLQPATVRQRAVRAAVLPNRETKKSRASKSDKNRVAYLDCLANSAKQQHFDTADNGFAMGISCIPLKAYEPESVNFNQVLFALKDLSQGLQLEEVSLRQDLPKQLVQIIAASVGLLSDRFTGRRTRSQTDSTMGIEALLDSTGDLLGFRPDFDRIRQRRWLPILRWLEVHFSDQTTRLAVDFWVQHASSTHLALTPTHGLFDLMSMLKQSGINTGLLQICSNAKSTAVNTESMKTIAQLVQAGIGQPVRTVHLAHRRGRPEVYLVIGEPASADHKASRHGAGQSIAGLHCLFACAFVTQQLQVKA